MSRAAPLQFEFNTRTRLRFGVDSLSAVREVLPPLDQPVLVLHDRSEPIRPMLMREVEERGWGKERLEILPLPESAADRRSIEELLAANRSKPGAIIAFGGGSTIDTAKVLSLALSHEHCWLDYRFDQGLGAQIGPTIPLIAISTLAGTGTEISPAALLTCQGRKELFLSDHLCPEYAVVDPRLACGAPRDVSLRTGVDALVQGIEVFLARGANRFSDLFALEAVRMAAESLLGICRDPTDLRPRSDLAYAALLSNWCIKVSRGLGAAHALSNPLSARFGVHHGLAVGLLLPGVLRFNGMTRTTRLDELALALGAGCRDGGPAAWEAVTHRVDELLATTGVTGALRNFGVRTEDLDALGAEAAADRDMFGNPRTMTAQDATELYASLW